MKYLYYLEKNGCECALNWRRKFIMFYISLSLVLAILSLFKINLLTSSIIFAVFAALSIADVVIILQFVHMLKEEQCKCSEDLAREILQFIAIIKIAVYSIALIVLLYSVFNILIIGRDLNVTNSFKKSKK